MLFSEPKIPQSRAAGASRSRTGSFSALQRAENSSIESRVAISRERQKFQCSSASRKFLNQRSRRSGGHLAAVSVLFSEPKIPQCPLRVGAGEVDGEFQCSSASRKFLNMPLRRQTNRAQEWFQCSSASRKFLNVSRNVQLLRQPEFQCSSASRKFLNELATVGLVQREIRFSALQRAENSSMFRQEPLCRAGQAVVSVLFSEPKIPQSYTLPHPAPDVKVSVLFCSSGVRLNLGASCRHVSTVHRSAG